MQVQDTVKASGFPLATLRQALSNAVYPEGAEQRNRAEREAHRDALTGLANRRALDRALPTAERDPHTSIIVFDLNNLGLINKRRGHQSGDWLLVELAAALRTVAIAYGVGERAFRRGGDEFVLLAPVEFAEAIRTTVEDTFGSYEIVSANCARVIVSVSGTMGNTFAAADTLLQARKRAAKRTSCVEVTSAATADAIALDRAHEGVRFALAEIAGEGTLDLETIDCVARALGAALRDIEAAQRSSVRNRMAGREVQS